ncbi:MAG: phage antirepressor KilAC domain-containing protein [Paludibacteraceae bacterium]|nr:phage antirepressor KilAC domain-containing protein [Paludibacteraceae bacterium]
MREITVFKHEMFGEVRTMVNENGETYFVGKDVAKALGYSDVNKAIRVHVDSEDKGVDEMATPGGKQKVVIINESGLYSLVLSSKLPQAKEFKHWVTAEVLPQIRKTGGYIPTKDNSGRQLSDMEILALALQIQQNTIEMQHRQIEDMAPKAEYCDEVLESVSCFTTTQVAKELNMTVHELTHLLIEQNVMYKQSGQYMLYKDYAHKGYAKNRTHSYYDGEGCLHTSVYLVWTEEGRKFIHRLLSDEEIIVPFILTIND